MKKTTLKTRILLFVLMLLMVVSLATAAIVPIKNAIEKSKELGTPAFTPEQIDVYTTQGGTPFLDGGYTVFGEVEEGLDVVEAIQNVATSMGDRPKTDVVMNVTVME